MTSKRAATKVAAAVLTGVGVLAAAGPQPAAADPPGDPNFNSCNLSDKVNELAGWDDLGKYNIVVWKENHRYTSVFNEVVAEGTIYDYDCNAQVFSTYFYKVFKTASSPARVTAATGTGPSTGSGSATATPSSSRTVDRTPPLESQETAMRTTYRRVTAALLAGAASATILVPTTGARAAQAADPGPRVEVIAATINITKQLIKLIDGAIKANQNRGGYVKSLSEAAFHEADGRYNVMVINDANRRVWSLGGVVYEAKASGHHGTYHILVFKEGFVKNEGDGGWGTWAYLGWWNRNGQTVKFHQP